MLDDSMTAPPFERQPPLMIERTDDAIVLSARRNGETAATVSLLTRAHGRHAGLVHGGAGGCWPATEMFRILETHSDPYF